MKTALFLVSSLLVSFSASAGPTDVPDIIDAAAIDWNVKPCDDFYKFACGKWLTDLQMPADKSTYYHQFTALDDQTQEVIRKLIETAPRESRMGRLYASCMNEDAARSSAAPLLAASFKAIDRITDAKTLATTVATLQLSGVNAFFGYGAAQDLNDAAQVIGFASEGGLSLPERDYYLKDDAKSVETRTKFVEHVARALTLAGAVADSATAAIEASRILAFETTLAKSALSLEDQGDPSKINHPVTYAGLKAAAPNFDWDSYFASLGALTPAQLDLTEPDFYAALNGLLASTSLDELRIYLKWHVVQRSAPLAGPELETESFNFWSGYLRGAKAQEPRWKRCVNVVSGDIGDDVGQAFVALLKDSEQVKKQTQDLIDTIKAVFSTNLDSLTWLNPATVTAARAKLALVNDKVAFPDRWKDYSSLSFEPGTLLANDLASNSYEMRRQLAKIGKPVDRAEWGMPPWEINAYYDPSLNEIVFPYGILQNPVFNLNASVGANMGALGATVGHELTHGFDNDGSKYDGHGNVLNWWPEEIRASFNERAQCLVNQANAYQVLPGLFVNGGRTLTENIADQGGTKLAYLAYRRMTAGKPPAPPALGFNEEQQYFLSYAQSWCAKRTDESMRLMLVSNVHPPEEFRVNGVLMNIPEFAAAFGCTAGQKMSPVNRCSVW